MPPHNAVVSRDLCERLDWDSSFFGRSIARALPSQLTSETCAAMIDWCRQQRIDCLYFLADASDLSSVRVAEASGFSLMDVRLTFARRVARPSAAPPDTRPAQARDIPALREIAGTAHRDTRFHADANFDAERADELYRTWIENSCRGYADHVIIAERENRIAGYLTLHLPLPPSGDGEAGHGASAKIGLFGVATDSRRQGIGQQLIDAALEWLADRSIDRVSVVTSGRNVAAQAFYQQAGFRTTDVGLWYHKWFGAP